MKPQTPAKITSVQLVRRYKPDSSVRRLQFDFEDKLKAIFPDAPKVNNLPENAKPETPRFIFQSGQKALLVCANSATLRLNFPTDLPKNKRLVDVIAKYANALDSAYAQIFDKQEKFFCGIAVTFAWPLSEKMSTIGAFLSERLLKLPFPPDMMVSANPIFAISKDGFYKNFDFSSYNLFQIEGVKISTPIHIDPHFEEGTEIGLQVVVDVNSKSYIGVSDAHRFEKLLPYLEEAINVDLPMLLGTEFKVWAGS